MSVSGAQLQRADLSRAYLARAVVDGSDLTGVRLVEADLDRTVFAGSVLADVVASGAQGTVMDEPARTPVSSDGAEPTGADLVAFLRAAGAEVRLFERDTPDASRVPTWRWGPAHR